jgi:hypothetical protein
MCSKGKREGEREGGREIYNNMLEGHEIDDGNAI